MFTFVVKSFVPARKTLLGGICLADTGTPANGCRYQNDVNTDCGVEALLPLP